MIERCDLWRRTARRWAPVAVTGMMAMIGLSAPLASGAAAQEATPTIGVLDSVESLPECAPTEIGEVPADLSPAATYAIDAEESVARYRSVEELANVGTNEAVGETNAIVGQIYFDEAGMPLACSRFDVDLRTLQSDEARRDNYLYNNTLETETYPLATFVLRAVEGLDAPLAEGEETPLTLIGDLTMHGVTKVVAWEATATKEGDALTATAATSFAMPEFEIEEPQVQVVVSIEDVIDLEVEIMATSAA